MYILKVHSAGKFNGGLCILPFYNIIPYLFNTASININYNLFDF
jgi:hypothetical protein